MDADKCSEVRALETAKERTIVVLLCSINTVREARALQISALGAVQHWTHLWNTIKEQQLQARGEAAHYK